MTCTIQKLSLLVEGHDEVSIDLTKPKEEIEEESFTIKNGGQYRLKFYFLVQEDIVDGLSYTQDVLRKGIRLDTMSFMIGSYGPQEQLQSFVTPLIDAPFCVGGEGGFKIKSAFYNNEKISFGSWEWILIVRKGFSNHE